MTVDPPLLATIAKVLRGTKEIENLLKSPFGQLFCIPANKTSYSGKIVHGLVCRQLVTKKRHEMWIVFGGHPIKFGIQEFAELTGLECGKYPRKKDVKAVTKKEKGGKTVWDALFGGKKQPTISDLVVKLETEEMEMWKKLALSLIVIVDGVLTCVTEPVKSSSKTVEMTKNIDFFFKYPWGRLSFERTLETITGFKCKEDVDSLVSHCKRRSFAVHGFPLALQLLAFETVPELGKFISSAQEDQAFDDRSVHNLAKLRPIRKASILACEAAKEVVIRRMVGTWKHCYSGEFAWRDEEEDHQVENIENLIKGGHKWDEATWLGGDDECPKQIRPEEKGMCTFV